MKKQTKKEKKAAKDPNKPKRPPSAFFVFMYATHIRVHFHLSVSVIIFDFFIINCCCCLILIIIVGKILGSNTRKKTLPTNQLQL